MSEDYKRFAEIENGIGLFEDQNDTCCIMLRFQPNQRDRFRRLFNASGISKSQTLAFTDKVRVMCDMLIETVNDIQNQSPLLELAGRWKSLPQSKKEVIRAMIQTYSINKNRVEDVEEEALTA